MLSRGCGLIGYNGHIDYEYIEKGVINLSNVVVINVQVNRIFDTVRVAN